MRCPIEWCGVELPENKSVRHVDHERWAREIAEGKATFRVVKNPDGSIDVFRKVKRDAGNR